MSCGEDLTGKKFGHLKILEKLKYKSSRGYYFYKCQCDCGSITTKTSADFWIALKNGTVCSCGECISPNSITGIKGIQITNNKFIVYTRYKNKSYKIFSTNNLSEAIKIRNVMKMHIEYGDFLEWYECLRNKKENDKIGAEIHKLPNETDRKFIIRARDSGMTFQNIGDMLGKSKQWVNYVYNKYKCD